MENIEEMDFRGLCPFCQNNDSGYGYEYQWDYCDEARDLIIDNNSNGICTDCGNFVLRR